MPTHAELEAVLKSAGLIEVLADIEHERWAHWQMYLHAQCHRLEDGSLVIPAKLAERWTNQIATPYEQLSESEKDSDREQVQRYLGIILRTLLPGDEPA
jgi:hypothetical protein